MSKKRKEEQPIPQNVPNVPSDSAAFDNLARDIIAAAGPPMQGGVDPAMPGGFQSFVRIVPLNALQTLEPLSPPDERQVNEVRRRYALGCAMQLAMGHTPGPPYFTSAKGTLEPEKVVSVAREMDRFLSGD